MKTFVNCCAALCAVTAILAIGGSAFADPYILTTVNSPGSGSGPIVFDGPPTFQYAPATANPLPASGWVSMGPTLLNRMV